ncbi:hlyD secretion family protein, partial [Vibrio parahaemolyticus V-223/04]
FRASSLQNNTPI